MRTHAAPSCNLRPSLDLLEDRHLLSGGFEAIGVNPPAAIVVAIEFRDQSHIVEVVGASVGFSGFRRWFIFADVAGSSGFCRWFVFADAAEIGQSCLCSPESFYFVRARSWHSRYTLTPRTSFSLRTPRLLLNFKNPQRGHQLTCR